MKPFIQITTPHGTVYEIPTEIIASLRAVSMLKQIESPTLEDASRVNDEVTELFQSIDQVRAWVTTHLSWDDIAQHARMTRHVAPDALHADCTWTFHDAIAITGEASGENILSNPLELTLNNMATNGLPLNAVVLHDANGRSTGAAILVLGSPELIHSTLQAVDFVAKRAVNATPADSTTQTH